MNRWVRTCLLLLAAAAVARASPEVDRAVDPNTSPSERIALLRRIVETPEGRLELARRGLDPALDPEVIHAVVDALLAATEPGEHIEPICRLLLKEPLRSKVQSRIQRVAEDAASAQKLLAKLEQIALGRTEEAARDPRLRVAAVRALGSIPRRAALEIIVTTWKGDKDADVRKECREALADVIDAPTPQQVEAFLRERPYASYFDLSKERLRTVSREYERLKGLMEEMLQTTGAQLTFRVLKDYPGLADVASRRILQLAEEAAADGRVGGMPAAEFADQVFAHFEIERAAEARLKTIGNLCHALAALAQKPATSVPLLRTVPAAKLAGSVAVLAGKGPDWNDVGEASVRLLEALGDPAKGELIRFASTFSTASVRASAVRALGQLARQNTEGSHFIALQLAELLAKEKEPEVRQHILFALKTTPVEAAVEPIRALFFPAEGKSPLTGTEPSYCVDILRKVETPGALEVLLRLTREGEPDVRKLAAGKGLLPRANGGDQQVIKYLSEWVLDDTQPMEIREAFLAEVGEQGKRAADRILAVARAEHLDERLRSRAKAARFRLAERLAVAGAEAKDLAAANEILREEWTPEDPESHDAVEAVARSIVQLGDAQKGPVGDARCLVALVQLARHPDDRAALLSVFREACDRAAADRPSAGIETRMLEGYRSLLKDSQDEDRDDRYVTACRRLADLAGDDTQKVWNYWLDAIEYVVDGPKNRARAESLYRDMPKGQNGAPEGRAGARWQKLRERIEALPVPKPDNP